MKKFRIASAVTTICIIVSMLVPTFAAQEYTLSPTSYLLNDFSSSETIEYAIKNYAYPNKTDGTMNQYGREANVTSNPVHVPQLFDTGLRFNWEKGDRSLVLYQPSADEANKYGKLDVKAKDESGNYTDENKWNYVNILVYFRDVKKHSDASYTKNCGVNVVVVRGTGRTDTKWSGGGYQYTTYAVDKTGWQVISVPLDNQTKYRGIYQVYLNANGWKGTTKSNTTPWEVNSGCDVERVWLSKEQPPINADTKMPKYDYKTNSIKYMQNGAEVTALTPGELTVEADIDCYDLSQAAPKPVLVAAQYDTAGNLVSVNYNNGIRFGKNTVTASLNITDSANDVKVMLWNDFNSLKPLDTVNVFGE